MERWIAALQDDYKIQVVTQTKNDHLDPKVEQVVYALNPAKHFPLRQIKMIWQIYKVKQCIRKFSPDVLHVHYAIAHPIFYALPEEVPMVTSLWGSDLIPLPGRPFIDRDMQYLRKYFERSKKVTAVSSYMVEIFHKLFKEEFSRPTVVPFGIDTNLFAPELRANQKPVVVGFARAFLQHYGFLDLLFACEPLMKEGLMVLRVAGDGEGANLYKYEVERLGLKKYVTFVGRISPVFKMPGFYHSIDIFAAPSHRESFGVAALEAASCGLPVVASDIGGLHETIEDGVSGLLFKPHEIDQLREAIRKLLLDENLRKTMGEAGRKKVQQLYEWKENVLQMKKIYEDVTK